MRLFGNLATAATATSLAGRFFVREPYGRTCDRLMTIAAGAQFAKQNNLKLAIAGDFNAEMNRIDVERLEKHLGSTVLWDCSELYAMKVVACLRPVQTEFPLHDIKHEMATSALLGLYTISERVDGEPVRLGSDVLERARMWFEQVRNDRTSALMIMVDRNSLEGACLADVGRVDEGNRFGSCSLTHVPKLDETTVCDYRLDRAQVDHVFGTSPAIREAFNKLAANDGEAMIILATDYRDLEGDDVFRSLADVDPRLRVRQVVSAHRRNEYDTFWMELALMVHADVLFANHLSSCSALVSQWRGVSGSRVMFPTWCFGG